MIGRTARSGTSLRARVKYSAALVRGARFELALGQLELPERLPADQGRQASDGCSPTVIRSPRPKTWAVARALMLRSYRSLGIARSCQSEAADK